MTTEKEASPVNKTAMENNRIERENCPSCGMEYKPLAPVEQAKKSNEIRDFLENEIGQHSSLYRILHFIESELKVITHLKELSDDAYIELKNENERLKDSYNKLGVKFDREMERLHERDCQMKLERDEARQEYHRLKEIVESQEKELELWRSQSQHP